MYSIDSLKVTLFLDEITNFLDLKDVTYQDEEHIIVREYLEKRIKELKKKMKNVTTK